jgi:hypothetical protein
MKGSSLANSMKIMFIPTRPGKRTLESDDDPEDRD